LSQSFGSGVKASIEINGWPLVTKGVANEAVFDQTTLKGVLGEGALTGDGGGASLTRRGPPASAVADVAEWLQVRSDEGS